MNFPNEIEKEILEHYGLPGENQVVIDLPYAMKLSWNTNIKIDAFMCHEKISSSIVRILTNVKKYYSENQIEKYGLNVWGGCLKVRSKMNSNNLSLHSWGIAIDIDPNRNKFNWGAEKAQMSLEEYKMWWGFWQEEGWYSLGLNHNYDWMHIQAALRVK